MLQRGKVALALAGLAAAALAARGGLRITGFDVSGEQVTVSVSAGRSRAAVELFGSAKLDGSWSRKASGVADGAGVLQFTCPVEAGAASGFYRAALSEDSDGDGLTDVYETLVLHTDCLNADTDGDRLPDGWEVANGLDPLSTIGDNGALGDVDGDGVKNLMEYQYGLSSSESNGGFGVCNYIDWYETYGDYSMTKGGQDSDGDGLPDDWELRWGFDPNDPSGENGSDGDPDSDWLSNIEEYRYGTDPWMRDTDGDTLGDWDEIYYYGSNPFQGDSDNDGIGDREEANDYGTDLSKIDSDGDGLTDWDEINVYFTNPASAEDDEDGDELTNERELVEYGTDFENPDTDEDGMPDGWEARYELNPRSDDAADDLDEDGVSNIVEHAFGMVPNQPDTDGDALHDGWEFKCMMDYWKLRDSGVSERRHLDPTVENETSDDPDEDGLSNEIECMLGSNPYAKDTDLDGVSDADEFALESDPIDAGDHGAAHSRPYALVEFGDPSGSHSEKYRIVVEPIDAPPWVKDALTRTVFNARYGEVEIVSVPFDPKYKYALTLRHAGTDPSYSDKPRPDFDYELRIRCESTFWRMTVKDPDGLCGVDGTSISFAGKGKRAIISFTPPPMECELRVPLSNVSQSDIMTETRQAGNPYRFWINNDRDSMADGAGVANDAATDIPSAEAGGDGTDGQVNGCRDLIDFFPVQLAPKDFRRLWTESGSLQITARLRQADGAVNVVWTQEKAMNPRKYQLTAVEGCGENMDTLLSCATVVPVTAEGVEVPDNFLYTCMEAERGGIFLVEGRKETAKPLVVEFFVDGTKFASAELPLCLTPVEKMYRWSDMREMEGGESGEVETQLEKPENADEESADSPHLVFVHGYNVGSGAARGWAAEVFKRLWQSGFRGMFTSVDWFGNESQLSIANVTPNYYANVVHAFNSAHEFASLCEKLPGRKFVVAHSLGNMLVSAAAKDWNLEYEKYYMVNAAVAIEAYDPDAPRQPLMVDGAWRDLDSKFYAAKWHELFKLDDGPYDFRAGVTWRGRFAGLTKFVNLYSASDEVVKNPSKIKVFGVEIAEDSGGVWPLQELFKGCVKWLGVTALTGVKVPSEGGWGINDDYFWNPLAYLVEYGLLPSHFKDMTRADMIENPVFTDFKNEALQQERRLDAVDDVQRNALLADAIPAETYAAGANPISGDLPMTGNINMETLEAGAWPRSDGVWRHSDIKDVPYCNNYLFYDTIRNTSW